ncbi:hypothetical protein AV530_016603 [Patagioenas fasciata monilis]|uniref:Mos1 transposase HTH domain-containing protein n=1 Tax=Patagioenas fasciata monilis TaxID=372326 RepID=A0A1V4J465_PATFA|nr:hypothetical protein AV530_016603 [Patagioenas fasciata monilis]
MEMFLDKKQIRVVFLLKYKTGHKAVKTTCNINNTFGSGTANEHTVQQLIKKFCKGDGNLKDEEHSGWLVEGDKEKWRAMVEVDPLTTTQEVAEELEVNHSVAIWHLNQIGKVKKLSKWVPHELTENQKYCCSEMSSYSTQQQRTIFRIVTCDEKRILYRNQ